MNPNKLPIIAKNIFQSNQITMARYSMSETEKSLFYLFLSKFSPENVNKEIQFTVKELEALTGKKQNYKYLKLYANNMFPTINIEDEEGFIVTTLMSYIRYKSNEGIIYGKFSEMLIPHLINLQEKFTVYKLEDVMLLSGSHPKRWYEIFMMWGNSKKKSQFVMSIQQIKDTFDLYKYSEKGQREEAKEDMYKETKDMIRRVIASSVDEINKKTSLQVAYEVLKTGRKITAIKFTIINSNALDSIDLESINPILLHQDISPRTAQKQTQKEQKERAQKELEKEDYALYYSKTKHKILFKALHFNYLLSPKQAYTVLNQWDKAYIESRLSDIDHHNKDNAIQNIGAYTAKVFDLEFEEQESQRLKHKMAPHDLWKNCLKHLKHLLPKDAYKLIEAIRVQSFSSNRLILEVPSVLSLRFVSSSTDVKLAIKEFFGDQITTSYEANLHLMFLEFCKEHSKSITSEQKDIIKAITSIHEAEKDVLKLSFKDANAFKSRSMIKFILEDFIKSKLGGSYVLRAELQDSNVRKTRK